MEKARMLGTEEAVVGGTEGGRSPTGVPPATAAAAAPGGSAAGNGKPIPDPAVSEKPVRRRFTAEYKLRILREADRCTESGQLGALLRREGLYSSHLSTWRQQRDEGTLAGLTPKRRGRKANPDAPLIAENQRLKRETQRLAARLRQAETIIEVQKKLSEILGIPLPPSDNSGSDAMKAIEELSPQVGTAAACRSSGRAPGDALSAASAEAAQACGHATAQAAAGAERAGAATGSRRAPQRAVCRQGSGRGLCGTLGSGPVSLLDPHDVPHPGRPEGSPRATRPTATPDLPQAATGGHRSQSGLVLGHHQAVGAGEMDLLPPLRDPRHLQPLRGGLDAGQPRKRTPGRAVDPRDGRQAGRRSRPIDDPQRSWAVDAFADRGPTPGHAGDHQVPQPAARLRRQPVLGEPVQDAQVSAGVPRPLHQHRTRPGASAASSSTGRTTSITTGAWAC